MPDAAPPPDAAALTPEIERMSASELDALIAALIARRARMQPGPALLHRADDLLWDVRPAANGRAAELALYHPGLGWTAITLSRAQIEDMEDAFVFALGELPVRLNPAVG